jgi:hypothetical protein
MRALPARAKAGGGDASLTRIELLFVVVFLAIVDPRWMTDPQGS